MATHESVKVLDALLAGFHVPSPAFLAALRSRMSHVLLVMPSNNAGRVRLERLQKLLNEH